MPDIRINVAALQRVIAIAELLSGFAFGGVPDSVGGLA
jgi:hypothetical protein